jgi:protein-tyrosine-phosphatase
MRKTDSAHFETYSAGPNPKDTPNPLTLAILRKHFEVDASDSRCKSWDEFRDKELDFVVTLGENELEGTPKWLGDPAIAQWHMPDPSAVEGTEEEKERAFWEAAEVINRRIKLMDSLPMEKLETLHQVV